MWYCMRKSFFVFITVLLSSLPAWAGCSKTLSFGMLEYPPYFTWDEAGHVSGLDASILETVMKVAGCDYNLHKVPFKRGLRDVKLGHMDGMPGVSKTAERDESAYFTVPTRREIIGLFARKNDEAASRLTSFEDIVTGDQKVGVVLGGWYGDAFTDAMNTPAFRKRVQTSENFLTLLRWLEAGLVDVAIIDLLSGYHLSQLHGLDKNIKALTITVHENDLYFMLGKTTVTETDILEINKAIQSFKASPAYPELLGTYAPPYLADFLLSR